MIYLLPLVLPWLTGAALLALDGRKTSVALGAALVLLTTATLDALLLLQSFYRGRGFEIIAGDWPRGIGIALRVDVMALFFAALCAFLCAVVMVHEAMINARSRLFPGLMVLLVAGLHGAFFTGDLFNFYVFFELAMVTSFGLAAYGYGRAEVRGAFAYIALNLAGSVTFLTGVAAVYHSTGTLDFELIAMQAGSTKVGNLIIPGALLFVGLSVKLGLFPYHGWVPVLYTRAHPAVAAAMSGALVNIAAYGMLRFGFSVLHPARTQAAWLLTGLGLIAIAYGAICALRCDKAEQVAAYIAVVHAGYLVLALGLGGPHGISAVLLTTLSGSLDKPIAFLIARGGAWGRPFCVMVAACSMAGFPLTAGFLSKVAIFRAALDAHTSLVLAVALVFSATLVVAAAVQFYRKAREPHKNASTKALAAPLLAAVVVFLGVVAAPLTQLVGAMSLELSGARL